MIGPLSQEEFDLIALPPDDLVRATNRLASQLLDVKLKLSSLLDPIMVLLEEGSIHLDRSLATLKELGLPPDEYHEAVGGLLQASPDRLLKNLLFEVAAGCEKAVSRAITDRVFDRDTTERILAGLRVTPLSVVGGGSDA